MLILNSEKVSNYLSEITSNLQEGWEMGTVSKLLSGTAVLIGMYLILKNSSSTVKVINSLGGVYTSGVKILQGR